MSLAIPAHGIDRMSTFAARYAATLATDISAACRFAEVVQNLLLYIRLRTALAASQAVLAAGVTAQSAAYPTCRAFQSSLNAEGRAVFVIRSVRCGHTIIWRPSHDMRCCSYLHAASLSGPRHVAACRQARNAAGSGAGTGAARRPAHVRHADYGAAFRHLRRARGRPRCHPQAHAGCVPSHTLIYSSKTCIFRHLRPRRLVVTPSLCWAHFRYT